MSDCDTFGAATVAALSGSIASRRVLFATLVVSTIASLLWLAAVMLSAGGFDALDLAILALFALTLPWLVIGFWNGTIGFLIMRFARDPVALAVPVATRVRGDEAIVASTAILLCVRNEAPEPVIGRIEPLLNSLSASGYADRFHLYVLSDTDDPAIAEAEAEGFAGVAERFDGRLGITYRRRTANLGYKAGNIQDFCDRWGRDHAFAVILDADSVMTTEAVLRLVRIMQADPNLGILQGLVVGLPSTSAFARIFQFGMRLGMRSYTIGGAWWQGDCGPYWGHNAVLRLAPFMAHCRLPPRPEGGPLGGYLLSHDQIEAVLMRRGGYEVRVLPEEDLGWEGNPPTLIEFIRRDLRWCQGNMQYWPFLTTPGLKPVNRYQIAFALIWFLGSPAWTALLALATVAVARAADPADIIRPNAGIALFAILLFMTFASKIATTIDVLSRPSARLAFGGTARFLASVAIETVFFLLLSPIMWFGHTFFLGGLLFGQTVGWQRQNRDDHAVSWSSATRHLWPHTLLGSAILGTLAFTMPAAIPYAAFIALGPALAIPLAVITASPSVGLMLTQVGIGRLPEETAPPRFLQALALPAVKQTTAVLSPTA